MYKDLVYDKLIIVNTRQRNGTIYPVAIGRGECVSGVGCWQYLQTLVITFDFHRHMIRLFCEIIRLPTVRVIKTRVKCTKDVCIFQLQTVG